MKKECHQCACKFEIGEEDQKFLEKISPVFLGKKYDIPAPSLCPPCRQHRRMAFRNERNLYHRKCDLTGKSIISMYDQNSPYKVYDQTEWWGDKWDAMDYGQEFDFSRPFFEQFAELMLKVPRINLINKQQENSEYCNFSCANKNCYLLFTSGWAQDSYYSNRVLKCRDVFDCSNITDSELCYEVLDSSACYNCAWLQDSTNCRDCFFGFDLKGCQDCFACYGLRNKQYCIANEQLNKEEYQERVKELKADLQTSKKDFFESQKGVIRKFFNGINAENCTGNSIFNSKNCFNCFEVQGLEDCKYVCNATELKDCYDNDNNDHSELSYEVIGGESDYHQCFADISWFNKGVFYTSLCFHSKNLFGCVGLKRAEYCILNKQYTKEEYEEMVPRVIEHMKKTGEFGEFFPIKISPFAYNETIADEYFPFNEEEVKEKGWKWKSGDEEKKYRGPDYQIPESIEDVDQEICDKILICEESEKPYKILKPELRFYKKMGIPVPKLCPDQRHKKRLALRNPRKLWDRQCARCQKGIKTTYQEGRSEEVVCEECYLQEL